MDTKRCRHKNHTFVKIIIVIAALYAVGTYFTLSLKLDKAKARYEQLRKNHAAVQQDTAELADVIENGIGSSDAYIIKIARKNGYILPTERVFIDIYGK
jgi:cell division protein FtsB